MRTKARAAVRLLRRLRARPCSHIRRRAMPSRMRQSVAAKAESKLAGLKLPPHAAWRLAPRRDLDHVVLWASHILVRHKDAEPGDVPFSPRGWNVQPPPSTRSREQAFELATSIAAANPALAGRVRRLARSYSEDTLTNQLGGSLGGVPASQFVAYPELLDAFAALAPGAVFRRARDSVWLPRVLAAAPPAAQRSCPAHRDRSRPGAVARRLQRRAGRNERRTREQAKTLALSIATQTAAAARTRSRPSSTATRSTRDAARGGDLGQW